MRYIFFGTIFAAMIIFLLTSLLLFSQRKFGERSRTIFAFINLLSVFNYLNELISFEEHSSPFVVMPVTMLLAGIFVISTYILYPIEVISPGWLNWQRVLKIYMPVAALVILYRITLWLGVVYTPFESIGEMLAHIGSFEVAFRIVLTLLFFVPVVLLYYLPYTRKYNNTDRGWMHGYITAVIINTVSFIIVICSTHIVIRTLYFAISLSCSLYIVYQELFVRLIREPQDELESELDVEPVTTTEGDMQLSTTTNQANTNTTKRDIYTSETPQTSPMFIKLEEYVNRMQVWRDPDLSVSELTSALGTNRTYLREAIQHQGYESYTSYINNKRIAEFIQIIEQQGGGNYSQTFFDVGFRSKTTALRNFREIIGATPSEYFQQHSED